MICRRLYFSHGTAGRRRAFLADAAQCVRFHDGSSNTLYSSFHIYAATARRHAFLGRVFPPPFQTMISRAAISLFSGRCDTAISRSAHTAAKRVTRVSPLQLPSPPICLSLPCFRRSRRLASIERQDALLQFAARASFPFHSWQMPRFCFAARMILSLMRRLKI